MQKEFIERSWELSEGLRSKALKDICSGRLQEQRAALLYGIPLQTLRQGLDDVAERRLDELQQFTRGTRDFRDDVTSHIVMSTLGSEARLVVQKVAVLAEQAEVGRSTKENEDISFPLSAVALYSPNGQSLPHASSQLRDALQTPPSPSSNLGIPTTLRIPQVRSKSDHKSVSAENGNMGGNYPQRSSLTESTASLSTASVRPLSLIKLRPPFLAQSGPDSIGHLPHRLAPRGSSLDESEEGFGCQDKDKQPRKKRGRYRQYDHELMEEAITMVMAGRMSVSKAQGVYGVPHSTLEYKVKERTGTLKNPPKKKSTTFGSSSSSSSGSGTVTSSINSGSLTSAADAQRS